MRIIKYMVCNYCPLKIIMVWISWVYKDKFSVSRRSSVVKIFYPPPFWVREGDERGRVTGWTVFCYLRCLLLISDNQTSSWKPDYAWCWAAAVWSFLSERHTAQSQKGFSPIVPSRKRHGWFRPDRRSGFPSGRMPWHWKWDWRQYREPFLSGWTQRSNLRTWYCLLYDC